MAANVSAQTLQQKYSTNIAIKIGAISEDPALRVLNFAVKNSGTGEEFFTFYREGRSLATTTRMHDGDGGVQSNWDNTNKVFKDLASNDTTDLTLGVATKKVTEAVPYWIADTRYNNTMLNEDGIIIRRQHEALNIKRLTTLLTPLKEVVTPITGAPGSETGGLVRFNASYVPERVSIPTANRFGDATKTFYENETEFFKMLSYLEQESTGANNTTDVGLLMGTNANAVIQQYDRASNSDWITTKQMETALGKKYTVRKFSTVELIPIKLFDETIDKKKIIGVMNGCIGFDTAGAPKPETEEHKSKMAKFFNLTETMGATVTDEYGVFLFEFNGEIGERVVKTQAITTP